MSEKRKPSLHKVRRIVGRTLVFRDAELTDAKFILSLRTDDNKSKHLTKTAPELEKQIAWLSDYSNRNDQVYFIIENSDGDVIGTVRLYDQQGDSFCWGSWIIKDGVPPSAAIESALMVYAYAIDYLGFHQSHFDVRKKNESVWSFHERFGAIRTGESEQDYFYKLGHEQISLSQQRYRKYLPESIVVEALNEH